MFYLVNSIRDLAYPEPCLLTSVKSCSNLFYFFYTDLHAEEGEEGRGCSDKLELHPSEKKPLFSFVFPHPLIVLWDLSEEYTHPGCDGVGRVWLSRREEALPLEPLGRLGRASAMLSPAFPLYSVIISSICMMHSLRESFCWYVNSLFQSQSPHPECLDVFLTKIINWNLCIFL